jgi:hypothetical protein
MANGLSEFEMQSIKLIKLSALAFWRVSPRSDHLTVLQPVLLVREYRSNSPFAIFSLQLPHKQL